MVRRDLTRFKTEKKGKSAVMESKTLFRILKKHLGDNAALLLSDNNFELYGDCGAKRKENEKKNELQEIVEAFD